MISVGDKQAVLYRGDQRPAALYRGGDQIAGYKLVEQIGTLLSFDGSYNDQIEGLSANGESSQIRTTQGKNLFDLSELTQKNDWVTPALYKSYQLKPDTQYTLSSNVPQTATANLYFNGSLTAANGVWAGKPITATSGSSGFVYIAIPNNPLRAYTTDILNNVYWVQLEEGATATAYEAFFPNSPSPDYPSAVTPVTGNLIVSDASETRQTLTLPTLNGIAAAGVYDTFEPYVIIDGVPRSRKTQRVGVKAFDGTEAIVAISVSSVYTKFLLSVNAKQNNGSGTLVSTLCNILRDFGRSNYDSPTMEGCCVTFTGAYVGFVVLTSRCGSTAASVQSYLAAQKAAGIPVTVYYALATPVVTLGAPVVIPTYPGQTIISAPAQITASARVRI